MNIVILGPAHPYRGGIAAFNDRLARQFQEEGHTVRIETFTLQYPDFLFPGKTQYSDDPPPAGISIRRTIHSMNPLNWLKAGLRLKKERPDLIISRFWIPYIGPSLGTIGRIAGKNKHTRVIGLTDNIIPHEHKPGDRMLTSWYIHSCQGIVTLSESVAEELNQFDRTMPRRTGPHPIYDHYGVLSDRATALKKLNLDPEYRYILFFGLIRDYKGLDLLLEAMADERIRERKIRLLVAGEFYSNEEKYRRLITESGLTETVIIHDRYIPDNQVADYFNAADLVAQPYKSATQSGVTQIAYHFHKPMLVTHVGGLPEMVPHGKVGYVCAPEPAEIAAALDDFYRAGRMEEFEKNVIEEKERFEWNHFTRLFYELKNQINESNHKRSHS
jgi:D-inositol-3-phosphate glycosyltransferase